MTEPGKNYPGQKGFPTPNETPDETACLVFILPASNDWSGLLLGAVDELLNPYNYYQWGACTPVETADKWQEIINDAVANNSCAAVVPAPWWDDESGDDADDEMTRTDQPWYGQIVILDDNLTFVENAFIWAVAGFIAYAGLPGAALSFVPIARKFVVTVKSNPLGGVIRFFADALEIGSVDTYSPTDVATEVQLALPDSVSFRALDADPPVFWAMLTDENPHDLESVSATIVRSRLSEADFSPTSLRYSEDCDCVEYTPDGGETWVRDDGDDPRIGTKFLKPLKTGSDIACRSAASMTAWIKNFIDYEAGVLETGATAIAVANAGLALFDILAPWAILINIIIDIAGTLFGIGATALLGAFDEPTYDELTCIFYCNMAADGSITEDDVTEMLSEIDARLNTTAALVLTLIIQAQGRVGLQNAGTLYEVEDPDCSTCDCNWCFRFDAATGLEDWVVGSSGGGTWNAGLGRWDGTVIGSGSYGSIYATDITKTFTATSITEVATRFGTSYNDGDRPTTFLYLSGVQVGRVDSGISQGTPATNEVFVASFASIVADEIRVFMSGGGSATVDQVTVRGDDTSPFGLSNC